MKKSMIVAAGLLLSTSAFASTFAVTANSTKTTDLYNTKAEAFEAGFDLSDEFKSMPQSELRFEFPVSSYTNVQDIAIDNTEVVVEEIATHRGEVQYRAVVDLDYNFKAKDNRH